MSLVEEAITRLRAALPPEIRVEGALELHRVTGPGGVQPRGISAYVVPSGLVGRGRVELVGRFDQQLDRMLSIIVSFVSGNGAALPQLDRIEETLDAIITALIGWLPTGATSAMGLHRSVPIAASPGITAYEITLSSGYELRIPT